MHLSTKKRADKHSPIHLLVKVLFWWGRGGGQLLDQVSVDVDPLRHLVVDKPNLHQQISYCIGFLVLHCSYWHCSG